MRRRKLPPDTRPDWRDPNMLVYRRYLMPDGRVEAYIDPDYEHRYRAMLVDTSTAPSPHLDPTYHLNRRKPRDV